MINQIYLDTQICCRVFKTNIEDEYQACKLIYVLEKTEGIVNWNLDLDDWENILRIDFSTIRMGKLTEQLSRFNIEIEELPIW